MTKKTKKTKRAANDKRTTVTYTAKNMEYIARTMALLELNQTTAINYLIRKGFQSLKEA